MSIGLYRGCSWYCCLAFYFLAGGYCSWPFIFWLVAIVVWFKCKTYRERYFLGDGMTDIAKMNIEKWTKECEKKWRKKK